MIQLQNLYYCTENEEIELNSEYCFVIWSKTKFDEGLDDQDLLAKFEKKFSKVHNYIIYMRLPQTVDDKEVHPLSPHSGQICEEKHNKFLFVIFFLFHKFKCQNLRSE